MAQRKKLSKRGSGKLFVKTQKVHRQNVYARSTMRGGQRL